MYRTPHLTPMQSKKFGRPCVNISLKFAFCSFASTQLYLHFCKNQLISKTQPKVGRRPLKRGDCYIYFLLSYINYFNVQVFQHKPTREKKISTTTEVYVTAMVPLKLFIVETGKYFNLSVVKLL